MVDDAFIRSYHDYNKLLAGKLEQQKREISCCLVHWGRFNINCDGTAVVCFNELFKGENPDSNVVLGSIKDQSIQDIWLGDKLNSIRLAQLHKNYSAVDLLSKLPCLNCSSAQSFNPNGKKTSEYQLQCLRDEKVND